MTLHRQPCFFPQLCSGVCRELHDTLYDVLTIVDDDGGSGKLARALERRKLVGAIVSRAHVGDKVTSRLRQAGVPFVLVGSSPGKTICQVDHDHRAACAELIRHLLRGKRRLALMGGDLSLYVVQDRLQGFLSACNEAGIQPGDGLLQLGLGSPEQTKAALDTLLKAGADCLVCMDDRICAMAISLLHHRGLRIPQDVQVASFYDSFTLETHTPAITALRFDAQKLGAVACQMLLDQLEGRETDTVKTVGYGIALRASTPTSE